MKQEVVGSVRLVDHPASRPKVWPFPWTPRFVAPSTSRSVKPPDQGPVSARAAMTRAHDERESAPDMRGVHPGPTLATRTELGAVVAPRVPWSSSNSPDSIQDWVNASSSGSQTTNPALGHRGRGRRRRCGSTPQTRALLPHSSTGALQLLDPKICGCDIGRESTVARDDEAPPLSQGGVRGRGVARGRVRSLGRSDRV